MTNKKITAKIKTSPPTEIPVQTDFIRLDAFLKLANAVESGGQAKAVIQEGRVRVNGEACPMRGKKLRPGDVVRFAGEGYVVTESDQPLRGTLPQSPEATAPPPGRSLGD